MPAVSEKQRKFFGAELGRKEKGEDTETDASEKTMRDFARKGKRSSKRHKARGSRRK